VPVIGARRRAQLVESLRALEVRLSADEVTQLEEAVPRGAVAGTRYAQEHMTMLDSEPRDMR
jgi:hypothetical protein